MVLVNLHTTGSRIIRVLEDNQIRHWQVLS